ncbi:putative acetyltransferase [Talaromyces proteolyticus]|uniref:Acetyltransferase n=1 Tax=Talaromyces proteolyticus TaxID=1131652 RepID=A0AAD4KK59_9EURO|nr:putative acetyltransferase [Talaromyces proteolyticus]KAH8693101.1 putative acetyltransferase [Talaromyces proteolyticus]
MAAVAPLTSVSNGAYDPETEHHPEHGPPRFTAVNGKETVPHSSAIPNAAATATHGSKDEQSETVDGNRNPNGYHHSSTRLEQRPVDGLHSTLELEDSHSPRSSSLSYTGANKNKRKRSESIERQLSHQEPAQDHAVRRSEGDIEGLTQLGGNEVNTTHTAYEHPSQPPADYTRAEVTEENRLSETNGSWQDYDSHLVSQAQKAQNMDTSDVQLAEALQREAHDTDSVEQRTWGTSRLSGSSEIDQQAFPPYSDKQQSAVQVGPKRKRVFSNRTKTGCMTCRRRKKKCDEQHPACNNCIRGGFVCEGYSSRSTWQKPSGTKGPIPLQSKEGYPEATNNHFIQDVNATRHDRASVAVQQAELNKVRSIVEDHDRTASQYISSPTSVGPARSSWSKRSWPGAAHPSYLTEHMTKSDYREVPSIHELSREGQSKADYHVVPSIRELSQQGSHPKPGMPIFQGAVDQRPSHVNSMDTSSPQTQARMALSIEHQLSARPSAGEDTERDKMVHGDLYRPFDIQLVEDRDRCKAALWRFNNACNPQSGVSSKEQNRLLREVIIPPVPASPSASPAARPAGSIGQGAVVEAPFRCHYGFNIHVGEDVMISENCSLVDDCPINIGAHTWIGPNVTILSSMAHANMQERKGSQSRYQGRSVTIEEDCYVGANCTIYPGVRLRRGAYVAPGEVVKTDIVAYGFQGLKPSYM